MSTDTNRPAVCLSIVDGLIIMSDGQNKITVTYSELESLCRVALSRLDDQFYAGLRHIFVGATSQTIN